MRLASRFGVLVLVVGVAAAGVACGGGSGREELRVLAAASLTEAFTDLAGEFERRHADVDVVFSFGGSPALVEQVAQGAPADVLATADEETMQRAVKAGSVGPPVVFAANRVVVAVREGNPEGIASVSDLARPGLVVVLCGPAVPCGRVAARVLDAAGVPLRAASLEDNVKAVAAKVGLGEADAGIVFATDVRADDARLDTVPIDGGPEAETSYLVAAVSPASRAARDWIALVTSPTGAAVLRRHGFEAR